MGGRGASSGISEKGNKYGSQYHTLLKAGNIKFVEKNEDHSESLLETMTRGRVYVLVSRGKLKSIYYFDNENKKKKSIDLDHDHKKMGQHAHHGYYHVENDGPKEGTRLTPAEKRMVDIVNELWYNRNRKSK